MGSSQVKTNPEEMGAYSGARIQREIPYVRIVTSDLTLGNAILARLSHSNGNSKCQLTSPDATVSERMRSSSIVVYLPSIHSGVPNLVEASSLFGMCRARGVARFVLVSSAAVYGASFRNPGLVSESYRLSRGDSRIVRQWTELEDSVNLHFQNSAQITILRCATLMSVPSGNSITRSFTRRVVASIPGHDPSIQLLSPEDLARAIDCVLHAGATGTYNVAPESVIPLREALRRCNIMRIPFPRTILRVACAVRGWATTADLDYARYSWTISNEKLKAIGFQPEHSSARASAQFRRSILSHADYIADGECDEFDDFGMDKKYIGAYGRTLFRFLAEWYWRIEVAGLEHIPRHGRAVLAGTHRGFMPWDGVMALYVIVKNTQRYPRFLIHPGLVKFPFLANFMTKLGGILACQENARRVLERDELLGVFPEGIQGAFVLYSQAYRIHDFHRDAFVKMALRYRAPIVPFVTVGSAEIFPIFAKLRSRAWTRYSEWPAIPITATFPFIPLPLPSKWHMCFLPPIHVERDYPPSAAGDTSVVQTISRQVRTNMQNAIDQILQRRPSPFFGSVFPICPQ